MANVKVNFEFVKTNEQVLIKIIFSNNSFTSLKHHWSPEITPGQGKISILVNDKRMGFQSFAVHSMANQIPLFNILDSILNLFQSKQSINLGELDKIISSELSTESNRKADVLEKYGGKSISLFVLIAM